QSATGVVTGAVTPPQDLYIARHNGVSSQDWYGSIDEVRIHNRALEPGDYALLRTALNDTLGAGAASAGGAVSLLPNPMTGESVTLVVNSADVEALQFAIYDLSGRLVHESVWHIGAAATWLGEDMAGRLVANGAYLVRLFARYGSGSVLDLGTHTLFISR
ncbi:MAG: hypothetical protein AB1778_01345, partial [Candidatus Bipolaricaulota bacterium]